MQGLGVVLLQLQAMHEVQGIAGAAGLQLQCPPAALTAACAVSGSLQPAMGQVHIPPCNDLLTWMMQSTLDGVEVD